MMQTLEHGGAGRCLCGRITYRFDAAPLWQAHCHCDSCRRACSAPFTSYFGVRDGHWRWAGAPAHFSSSAGVTRSFCGHCGAPMAFQSLAYPGETHFFAASLDTPAAFHPTMHVHWDERLPWVQIADGLRVRRSPRRLGPEARMTQVLALIRAEFAAMNGRIDPPSSMLALTEAALSQIARAGEIWTLDEPDGPIACVVLTPKSGALYVGKLSVARAFRRQGLARQLMGHAEIRARSLGLPALELQVRIELVENQQTFQALGFAEIGRTAHPGYDRPTSIAFRKELPTAPETRR